MTRDMRMRTSLARCRTDANMAVSEGSVVKFCWYGNICTLNFEERFTKPLLKWDIKVVNLPPKKLGSYKSVLIVSANFLITGFSCQKPFCCWFFVYISWQIFFLFISLEQLTRKSCKNGKWLYLLQSEISVHLLFAYVLGVL